MINDELQSKIDNFGVIDSYKKEVYQTLVEAVSNPDGKIKLKCTQEQAERWYRHLQEVAILDGSENRLYPYRTRSSPAKVEAIRKHLSEGYSIASIMRQFHVAGYLVRRIRAGEIRVD